MNLSSSALAHIWWSIYWRAKAAAIIDRSAKTLMVMVEALPRDAGEGAAEPLAPRNRLEWVAAEQTLFSQFHDSQSKSVLHWVPFAHNAKQFEPQSTPASSASLMPLLQSAAATATRRASTHNVLIDMVMEWESFNDNKRFRIRDGQL